MIKTPHIDQIASEGMDFRQMYAGAAVCSPSRAAMLTGRCPQRVGIQSVLKSKDKRGMPRYEQTLGELLQKQGYQTGIFGKWHLGHQKRHNPLRHGFDRYVGLLQSNDQKPVQLYEDKQVAQKKVNQSLLTRRFTDEAIKFVDYNQRRPFFLYVPYTAPHIPIVPEPRFKGTSQAGAYGDVVEGTDFHIGRLLDKIDSAGLTDNTIVILTSDNGPWFEGSAGKLRGGKTTAYEGGIRVPFYLRWPAEVRPGSSCDQAASFLDLLPTLIGIAGGKAPSDRPIDGIDLSSALKERPMADREALYFFDGWDLSAIRSGPWKLHLPDQGRAHRKQLRQLFNINLDPNEQYDQASRNPDKVRHLQKLANQFSREIARQKPRAQRRAHRK